MPRSGPTGGGAGLVVALALGLALTLVQPVGSASAGPAPATSALTPAVATTSPVARRRPAPARTRVLQLNLCLSGFARCYPQVAYPRGRREAVRTIRATQPNAVTVNEGCRTDLEQVAARTGMRLTFFPIPFDGRPELACKEPRERGGYGNAILTRGRASVVRDRAFVSQAGPEVRKVSCVAVRERAYCVTHLYPRATAEGQAVNDSQCRGFARVVGKIARRYDVAAAGDMNRSQPCLSSGSYLFHNDTTTRKNPRIQHLYTESGLGRTRMRGLPLSHTNHDGLLVTARRGAR